MAGRREASHAGSWYADDEEKLSVQLDRWLDHVHDTLHCIGPASTGQTFEVPAHGARVIIAPHAGYSYSGPAAAYAYKSLDLKHAKRIFILGPSHHFYLTRCALSQCHSYETPFGDLTLDHDTIAELHATKMFDKMSKDVDEAEHSIEMHLPYLHKMLSRALSDYVDALPPIIPILVGNTTPATETAYGRLLAPYLADPHSAFIISSDFCHWGSRFRYTYYEPGSGSAPHHLRSSDRAPTSPPIHASIGAVDMRCIGAVESGDPQAFWDVLDETGNTVCGRHPIGIVLAGLRTLRDEGRHADARFKFVRYERSSECASVRDSSVSYASAFAVL